MGMNLKQKEISKDSPEEAIDMRKMVAVDEKYITRSYFKEDKNSDSPIPSKKSSSKNSKNNYGRKLAEVFRTDFITAMKVPESQQLPPGEYITLKDTWRQEWEKGVQVPVNPESILKPVWRKMKMDFPSSEQFSLPEEFIKFDQKKYLTSIDRSNTCCNYDLDEQDMEWLRRLSSLRTLKKATSIDELTMERAITWFERECFEKMAHAVATKEGLSIEYDESTTCHVCLSPDAEDGNEIIFCDACMMCAHQHCYGVLEIPEGPWLCNPCSRGILSPPCCLCPKKGGAMKRMKDSLEWIHVICAWWIPEVKIEDVKYIERITKDKIPASRWNLICYICREKMGACIQCSVKRCVRAYHVSCAVKDGLEMKTVVIPEKNDVQHISFCSKHCTPVPPDTNQNRTKTEDFENNRLKELRKLESEFYSLVSIKKACRELKLCKEACRRLLSYWTMKRRANENVPLIKLTLEQQEKLSGKQGVVFINQQKTLEMERFLLLRQDLERLRNLCYMIVRREKMRKELHRLSMDVFYKQNDILLDEDEDLSGANLDFIRHRTTRFSCFSEHYQTDDQYELEHGCKLTIFDSTLDEGEELLNSSQIEKLDIKDIARVTGVKYDKSSHLDENSGLETDAKECTVKTEPDRNIFELLEPEPTFVEERRASTPDMDVRVQDTEVAASNLDDVGCDEAISINGYQRNDTVCVLGANGKKIPVSNNSVTSRLVKKGKKRFRNLHVDGLPNRNSPRLHPKLSVDDNDHQSEIENRNNRYEENHVTSLMKGRKRRRLNSYGDCIKEFEETPDYVRVTRSRVASCS